MSCSFLNDSVNNSKRKVIVGVSANKPPKIFVENGIIKGHVIDVLDELSKVTGLEFEFKEMSISSSLTALSSGLVDVVPCLIVTEERKKTIDFSYPYDRGFLVMVHPHDKPVASFDTLKGKKIAVEIGSAMEKWIDEKNKDMLLDLSVHRYDDLRTVIQSLIARKVDCTILPYDFAVGIQDNSLSSSIFGGEIKHAFGFKKDRDDDLIEVINSGIEILDKSARLGKLMCKWAYYNAKK